MWGSPRAGAVKIHNRPPTAHEEEKAPWFSRPLTKRNASLNSAIDSIYLNF
jgi:hypothetical protein